MTYFILTFLVFTSTNPPFVAAAQFSSLNECQTTEGKVLTVALNDDTVTGWIMVDECKEVGGTATKG